VPEHFTNIQAGLRFARNFLRKHPAVKQAESFCVTDGEPTATSNSAIWCSSYPPSERTARATLEEAKACAQAGIQVSTFALIEDYFYLGLKKFRRPHG